MKIECLYCRRYPKNFSQTRLAKAHRLAATLFKPELRKHAGSFDLRYIRMPQDESILEWFKLKKHI